MPGGEPWIVDLAPAPPDDLALHLARAEASRFVPDPAGLDFEPIPLSAANLLPPVTPSKIVCVGRNYLEHARELGNGLPDQPLPCFKPPSSFLTPSARILPRSSSSP